MPFAAAKSFGFALKARLGVKGIQKLSSASAEVAFEGRAGIIGSFSVKGSGTVLSSAITPGVL
jgi:hypothetical protein